MKEVLVVYYTQTGQLSQILENITGPLDPGEVRITYYRVEPTESYPFPWDKTSFYNTFPESFLQVPQELKAPPAELLSKKFDLVILGYQVWFLTPSRPMTSFMRTDFARDWLKDTPVVTVVACRNMWIQAQEKMKRLLRDAKARHVGHIALVDRNINHISVITIQHWMFSGRKDRYLGIFPKPGVSDADIAAAGRFGNPIREALDSGDFEELQSRLLEQGGVRVNPYLVRTDERGNFVFSKWANLLIGKGSPENPKRKALTGLFKIYLLFAIWVIAPIVFIIFLLTYLPMRRKRNQERIYYSSVALKESL